MCDSLHCETTFLDGFFGPVKIEQAKVRQPRRHDQIWRLARHPAARIRTCMMLRLVDNTSRMFGIANSSDGCADTSGPRLSCSLRIHSPTTPGGGSRAGAARR